MTNNKAGQPLSGAQLRERQKQNKPLNTAPGIIASNIKTPENAGSILRVADAAGCSRVIFCGSDVLQEQRKVERISRAASRHIAIQSMSEEELVNQARQFQPVVALELTDASKPVYERNIDMFAWVMLGSESRGIPLPLLSICSAAVHIPMYGEMGSMNVSHALAIYLYEWRRQHETV